MCSHGSKYILTVNCTRYTDLFTIQTHNQQFLTDNYVPLFPATKNIFEFKFMTSSFHGLDNISESLM